MKPLAKYIIESTEEITKVTKLTVTYKAVIDDTVVKVPSNYSESDMQIYLDDKCLNDLPGSNDASKKLLGDNVKEISDAYFSYSKYTASDELKGDVALDWDEKYDANNSEEGFTYYTLNELKYIIEFSEFDMKDVEEEELDEKLREVFESMNSNNTNKYPIEIELEDITYNEQ